MQYTIVYGETINALKKAVNDSLASGWRPQGGITIEMGMMYQALVKEDGNTRQISED